MPQPVVPESFWIEYLDPLGGVSVVTDALVEGETVLAQGADIDVQASYRGGIVSISLTARTQVRLRSCSVTMSHAFAPDERIIANGYQTWTDTHQLSPTSVMRGLRRVPRGIVKRFALDGSGDYRFVTYDERRGHLHGWTYTTLGQPEDMVLVASVDESHGFTLIRMECERNSIQMETEVPNRILEDGEKLALCRYLVTQGTEDEVFDQWFDLMEIRPRPAKPLIGYTSWYRHYEKIDEEKIFSDLEATAASLSQIEAPGALKLFQIDDGFAKVGDWLQIDGEKFPQGLALVAQRADELGLTPGLWLAPFVCEKDSDLFSQHPDWLLRDRSHEPVATGSHWSGGYALDTLNPGCRDYIRTVVHTVVQEWGFRFLKLDFLYAACMLPHDDYNRGELMTDGTQLLREAAGDDCLLLGCGVPLAPAFGRLEYCRIGCDVGLDWNDRAFMRLLHRERVSTKNSMLNTQGRSPLDGRAFRNDPDVFFLRSGISLAGDQKMLLLETDATCASVLLTSDDMSLWSEGDRLAYGNALAKVLARESGKDQEA